MKIMKKNIKAFLCYFTILITLVQIWAVVPVRALASGVNALYIHYNRPDANYTNWDLWLWPTSQTGPNGAQPLLPDANGVVAKVDVSAATAPEYGFIVRKTDWSQKDPGPDMSVVLQNQNNTGEMHIYVKSGDDKLYLDPAHTTLYTKPNVPTLQTASFISNNTIAFSGVNLFGGDTSKFSLEVYDENNALLQGNVLSATETTISYKLATATADVTKKYTAKLIEKGTSSVQQTQVRFYKYFNTAEFNNQFTPDMSTKLGVDVSTSTTAFKLWTPTATAVTLNVYETAQAMSATTYPMQKGAKGVWEYTHQASLEGKYYTYSVTNYGSTTETMDPYAQSATTNGTKGLITNASSVIEKEGLNSDQYVKMAKQNDAIIYEAHIRDLSMSPTTNTPNNLRGKYLGVVQEGTKTANGTSTGIDHMKSLGVTHVHFLPMFDYASVNESKSSTPQFNWGYDPLNYNVPEGSYSTDPANGYTRVKEMKQMVAGMHKNNLGVVMDVVYNHTYSADHAFQKTVPDYYYRQDEKGGFANGTGVGNETASERVMMRKYMVDSVAYWASTYKIDGFRFDLMGIHDITTMNMIADKVRSINPDALIYGEGWDMGQLPIDQKASKMNVSKLNNIAVFNDDFRNGAKGPEFGGVGPGFVQRDQKSKDTLQFGFTSTNHPNNPKGFTAYATNTNQIVNYVSAHDNYTLYDKLKITNPVAGSEGEIHRMAKISNALVMTSPGVPFLHAGVEMLRTKGGNENSYNAPDSVNMIDYSRLESNKDVVDYEKGLIQVRKNHPLFRQSKAEELAKNLTFLTPTNKTAKGPEMAYAISANGTNDSWKNVFIGFNNSSETITYQLPVNGEWTTFGNNDVVNENGLETKTMATVTIAPYSTIMMFTKNNAPTITVQDQTVKKGSAPLDLMSLVKASDVEDGDITSKVTIKENKIDYNTVGKYTVVYTVTDSDGNTVEKTMIVTVEDNTTDPIKPIKPDPVKPSENKPKPKLPDTGHSKK